MVWYTDGIKSTVFQAKIRVIAECALSYAGKRLQNIAVVTCSDSEAPLGALDGYLVGSCEVLRYKGLLGDLARANSISLL